MSLDRDLRMLRRRKGADPHDKGAQLMLFSATSRINVSRCQCMKEPYRFFIVCRKPGASPIGLIKSRWIDALQHPFSRAARSHSNDWQEISHHDYQRRGPAPIACEKTLMAYAKDFGLADCDRGPRQVLLNPKETIYAIYSTKPAMKIKKASKHLKGICRRCGLPRKNTKVSP